MDTTTPMGWLDSSTVGDAFSTFAVWNPTDYLWTIIFGFIVAFILAFAVGANDVANSFGTTVGAKVLTLRTACILASIFETLGAVLLGAKVGETIRKGIIDVSMYNDTGSVENGRELLMIGEVSAMSGAAIWQLIATSLGLPVSGTHSIVGSCIGFSLVAAGAEGVNWKKLGMIIASWFISPVIAGIMAVSLYIFVKRVILEQKEPLINGLRCLPFFYAFTFGTNCFSIFYTGFPMLGWNIPNWSIILITIGLMLIVGIAVQFAVVPRLRKRALKEFGVDEFEDKLTPLKRFPSNESSPSPIEWKKSKNRSDTMLNDSGYQTPNYPPKQTNIVTDLSGRYFDDEHKADEITVHIEKEIETPERRNSEDNISENEEAKEALVSLKDTSSYDGGDSDSAFEEKGTTKVKATKSHRDDEKKESETEEEDEGDREEDPPVVRQLFSSLQILTACFGSFAHGGNDVSNAIGPLIALWLIYHSGSVVQKAATPWYLLLYGGAGIIAGLWILGRRVIKTIGSDLTKITPSRGFCIELMTALTVLVASNAGIPVSTTHCKVGSVVSIGWFRSRSSVTWSTVRNIALAWFVTVPVSGAISALVMYILMLIVR